MSPKPSTWPPGRAAAARPAAPIRAGFLIRISFGRSRWPSQIWSGCSESQAIDERDPSISYCSEFFRPALIWLMLTEPRAPFSKRSRIVAASSVAMPRVTVSVATSVEKVSTGPVGSRRVRTKVARSAMTATTRWPVTNVIRSSQCEPMSPTARRAPPRPGSSRQFQSLSRSSQSWK